MNAEQVIEHIFQQSISAKIDCVEVVAPALARAAELLTHCLLSDRKLLVGGNGGSSFNAQYLTSVLVNQGERERPGLPAVLLDNSNALLGAAGQDYGINDSFARQIRALGQPGDCLVLFTQSGTTPSIINAIAAARERDINIVALTANDGGHVPALLDERDIEIRVPLSSRYRIYEVHLLLSFALCELIENLLFGEEQP